MKRRQKWTLDVAVDAETRHVRAFESYEQLVAHASISQVALDRRLILGFEVFDRAGRVLHDSFEEPSWQVRRVPAPGVYRWDERTQSEVLQAGAGAVAPESRP